MFPINSDLFQREGKIHFQKELLKISSIESFQLFIDFVLKFSFNFILNFVLYVFSSSFTEF